MLKKFKVCNFKSFEKEFVLDLSATNGYTFNTECIRNGIVNCAMVYGYNGIGKSNLGWAIFDIIEHLTDKSRIEFPYRHYLNACSKNDLAEFSYEFLINESLVRYDYGKTDYKTLVYESLWINDRLVVSFDRREDTTFEVFLKGAETLRGISLDSQLSVLKYVKNNTVLEDNAENEVFYKFFSFVEHMLFFRSLEDRSYIGQDKKTGSLVADIIKNDKVKDFEAFLNEANVSCKLSVVEVMDDKELAFDFGEKKILFREIMSTGTSSLMLFYCWCLEIIKSNVSFVFIDEFDAFYHHELSKLVVKKLKESGIQFILTTHNTSIMSNDLMRPDCYFLMNRNKILPLSKCTEKELREAHNIEKIYKAGAFYVE